MLISTGIIKKLVETARNKTKKHNIIVILARSNLNSIESIISEALINNEINHEDVMMIINEKKNYRELQKGIRMMNGQRSDSEKINLIEEGKRMRINIFIKNNKIINNSFKAVNIK